MCVVCINHSNPDLILCAPGGIILPPLPSLILVNADTSPARFQKEILLEVCQTCYLHGVECGKIEVPSSKKKCKGVVTCRQERQPSGKDDADKTRPRQLTPSPSTLDAHQPHPPFKGVVTCQQERQPSGKDDADKTRPRQLTPSPSTLDAHQPHPPFCLPIAKSKTPGHILGARSKITKTPRT